MGYTVRIACVYRATHCNQVTYEVISLTGPEEEVIPVKPKRKRRAANRCTGRRKRKKQNEVGPLRVGMM
jgi:hypothetical protein